MALTLHFLFCLSRLWRHLVKTSIYNVTNQMSQRKKDDFVNLRNFLKLISWFVHSSYLGFVTKPPTLWVIIMLWALFCKPKFTYSCKANGSKTFFLKSLAKGLWYFSSLSCLAQESQLSNNFQLQKWSKDGSTSSLLIKVWCHYCHPKSL